MEDLQRLPVLARETVREDPERFVSKSIPPHQLIRAGTTGTTGANLKVAYTSQLERENWAFLLRQWSWARDSPARTSRYTFFGARVIPAHRTKPPFWTFNRPERQALASIFHLSEKTAGDYLPSFLERNQGQVLEGFPSVLGMLADFALQCGRPIPMRVTFTSGEPLYADVRAKIESAFHARVFDSYGMTEYCGQIQECEHGRMHLVPEYGFLEILDKNDEPVGPDEEGDFVWTGLLNRAMPLIRYMGSATEGGGWPVHSALAAVPFRRWSPQSRARATFCGLSMAGCSRRARSTNFLKESASLRFCQFVHDRPERVVVRAVVRQ